MSTQAPLARKLGFVDAVVLGLASMIGAGVFVVFAPAAEVAGSGLLVGLAIAACVALCNALSSAQLAARYPMAGGAYVYGRERLGEWAGFMAGWSFVVGKTASCAAMAMAFAAYLTPEGWHRPIAVGVVVVLVTVNCFGITRTALVAKIAVAFIVAVLIVVIVIGTQAEHSASVPIADDLGAYGVLQSAGLLFFAFAGFARLATLGEEVRSPTTTIPRAILSALTIVVVLYALVAVVLLTVLGPSRLALSTAPLIDLVDAAGWGHIAPLVTVAASVATLGALLALLAGVSRTALAMARTGDLWSKLASIDPRSGAPVRAEIVVGCAAVLLVLFADLTHVIAFSSFGVLLYYTVANVAAFTQPRSDRRYPRLIPVLGVIGCLTLVTTLPVPAIAIGSAVLLIGVLYRLARLGVSRRRA